MTTPPSSGDSREDAAARAAAAVAAIYAAAETAILTTLAYFVAKAAGGVLLATVARRRLRAAVAVIIARAEAQAEPVLARAAQGVRTDATEVIARDLAGLTPLEPVPSGAASITRAARDATAEALKRDAAAGWRSLPQALHDAGLHAYRAADDAYQQIIRDVMQHVTSAGTALPQMSRLQAAQRALDKFAERGITGFTDTAGHNWDLTSYTEMATRTAASRMHLALQLGAMGPAGLDLVIVDNPTRLAPCKICRPFEGKVLSVSGAAPPGAEVSATGADGRRHATRVLMSVAESRAAGLWHPNCRHSMIPFTDGAGFLPLAGGDERGYIKDGRIAPSPLPIGTPADYEAEQKLRAHERAVRRERRLLAVARTAQARARARARVAGATGRLEDHVRHYRLLRNRSRERLGRAR